MREQSGFMSWLLCGLLSACVPVATAQGPVATPRRPVPAPARAPLEPHPLPDSLTTCARHSDCSLVEGPLRAVETAADCLRPPAPISAVNTRGLDDLRALLSDNGYRLCPQPDSRRPPPVNRQQQAPPTAHAACVEHRCTRMRGGSLTRDELAEEKRGESSRARSCEPVGGSCCYLDTDCPVPPAQGLTAFPEGATDARGEELCPVCERPGKPLPDEAERLQRLRGVRQVSALEVDREDGPVDAPELSVPLCPPLSCRARSAQCESRACRTITPSRTRRAPVPVSRFSLPPEPEEPAQVPDLIELPRGDNVACRVTTDCVVQAPVGCSCAPYEIVNRQARTRTTQTSECTRPCNVQLREEQARAPVATCYRSVCVDAELAREAAKVARERPAVAATFRKYLEAHRRWERRRNEVQRALERAAERESLDGVEVAPSPP